MGILARLCLLLGVALVPMAAIQLHDVLEERQARDGEMRAEAAHLARVAALEQGRIFAGTRQLLFAVTQLRPLALQNRDLCNAALARLVAHEPRYAYIATLDLDGNILCASTAKLRREDMAPDRPFFAGALTGGDFAVGIASLAADGTGVLQMGFPLAGDAGKISEVAVAGLRLDALAADLATIALPAGASLTVADSNGTVIARLPRSGKAAGQVGNPLPDARRALIHAASPGSFESREDGMLRIFGFEPVDAPGSRGVYVEVALDGDATAAAGMRDTTRRAIAAGAALLLGFALAALGTRRFIRRPTAALVLAARRWREGDWSARSGLGHGASEFDRLAHAFDEMAEALGRREQELIRAKDEAQGANRAKSRFLAAMSNELRAPLYAIIDFAEAIRAQSSGPGAGERDRESATYIHASAQHLLRLLNDLLDLSKLAAGQLELAESLVDLEALLRECASLLRDEAEQKKVTVALEIAPDLPGLMAGEQRLKQVFLNLLANAIKFSREGGAVAIAAGMKEGAIVVVVADRGIGMRPQDIPLVLEPFRETAEGVRSIDGAGLGLPLAKMLVEKHGGTLAIQSVPGSGTTVTVTLPASRVRPKLGIAEKALP